MSTTDINKLSKNDLIKNLISFIDHAQKNGGFELHVASLVLKAVTYLQTMISNDDKEETNKEEREKEIRHVNTLFQAVQVANRNGGFTLQDAGQVWEVLTTLKDVYDGKQESVASSSGGSKKKYPRSAPALPVKSGDEDDHDDNDDDADDDESVEEIPERSVKGKSKARAA